MRYLFLLFIPIFPIICHAIAPSYRAIYDYQYTKDSINNIKESDILFLELSESYSTCFSYYTYQTDSLDRAPDGKRIWRELFKAAISKDGINATSFPHKRSKFIIKKDYHSKLAHIKDEFDRQIYEYDDSIYHIKWHVTDSLQIINGFSAVMATGTFHGRTWNIWFTPELPWNDGPWMLCGLPGLILDAYDENELFSFKLIGLSPIQEPINDWLDKGEKTDRIKFLKSKYKYLKNFKSNFNAEMGTNIPSNYDTRYIDGLEPDFKYTNIIK